MTQAKGIQASKEQSEEMFKKVWATLSPLFRYLLANKECKWCKGARCLICTATPNCKWCEDLGCLVCSGVGV